MDAVDTGDLETVRELLADAPALISVQDGRTKRSFGPPLRLAIRRGHADIAEMTGMLHLALPHRQAAIRRRILSNCFLPKGPEMAVIENDRPCINDCHDYFAIVV